MDKQSNDTGGFSRRDFLKISGGVGAMALLGPSMAFAANPGAKFMLK